MSEPTRMTAPSGGSKDVKIERFDQIPPGPLAELAARYGVGFLKYEDKDGLNNWLHGYPWSWSYRAMIGHANAFWAGEDVDPATYAGTDNESPYDENGDPRPGVQHLAAVAWHAFALLEWMETHPENDDRVSTIKARIAAGLAGNEDAKPMVINFDDIVPWDPERIEEIRRILGGKAHVGTVTVTDAPLETISLATGVPADELVHQYGLELDDHVRVTLDDGRVIDDGVIAGIRKVNGWVRYDVTYGVTGWARLTFVRPDQLTLK